MSSCSTGTAAKFTVVRPVTTKVEEPTMVSVKVTVLLSYCRAMKAFILKDWRKNQVLSEGGDRELEGNL